MNRVMMLVLPTDWSPRNTCTCAWSPIQRRWLVACRDPVASLWGSAAGSAGRTGIRAPHQLVLCKRRRACHAAGARQVLASRQQRPDQRLARPAPPSRCSGDGCARATLSAGRSVLQARQGETGCWELKSHTSVLQASKHAHTQSRNEGKDWLACPLASTSWHVYVRQLLTCGRQGALRDRNETRPSAACMWEPSLLSGLQLSSVKKHADLPARLTPQPA